MARWRSSLSVALAVFTVLAFAFGSSPAQEVPDTATVKTLEQRLKADPENGELWLEAGRARLKAGDLGGAEAAFKKATGWKTTAARAYNGLGLVLAERPRQLDAAIYYFQMALQQDAGYVEAHYNKAQTYFKHNWLSHAIRAAEEAVAVDSTYAPARELIQKCRALQEDEEEAAREAYVKANPEDLEGWVRWSRHNLRKEDYRELLARLPAVVQAHPEWVDLLPALAQAYWRENLLPAAWATFRRYIRSLEGKEQALYEDLSLAASPQMAERYGQTTPEGRKAMARRFWAERDPDFTTQVNERLLEHYRRVWYSRTYFSKKKDPWDRRGEVYIRYGEPDHRSRSMEQSPPPTAAVASVKERFFNQIYSDQYMILAMGGGTEVRTGEEGEEGNQGTMKGVNWYDGVTGGLTGSLVGPVFPIRSYDPDAVGATYLPVGSSDFSMVPWESWVYTDVDGGVVIDFTDESGRGSFDYAPIPELGKTPGLRHSSTAGIDQIRAFSSLVRRSPKIVMQQAVEATPERYEPASGETLLDFYFDQAKFRGAADTTSRVEVYYGVPKTEAAYFPHDESSGFRGVCRIALRSGAGGKVYRMEDELVYRGEGDQTESEGFIPHASVLDVPPGDYVMDIRMENRLNGEIGVYRKHLSVGDFPRRTLMLSDIQLAWEVLPDPRGDGKFSKKGLHVIPMPTRLYQKGQPVYVYYEIYNLKRDEFGKTDYTVTYTVRSGTPPGLISRVVRALQGKRGGDREIAVEQGQLGATETEVNYVALDLSDTMPGEVALRVTVVDSIGGTTASEEAKFRIAE